MSTSSSHVALDGLTTEAVDSRFAEIDHLPVAQLAALMNEADSAVPAAVQAALPQIVPALEAASARMQSGGRLLYVGAGTPGRIGVLDAAECPPTFSSPPEQVFAVMAGGPGAVVGAVEGAEDDAVAGAAAMDAAHVGPDDTVLGITSSGRTPFVLGAVRRARELGALGIGLSCNPGSELSTVAEHGIEVIVGPEFISGSTRLKAGTAQKLVLNMFSTIVMVRLGKTYGNLMVDMRASNGKLRERATTIVRTITGVDRERAVSALEQADGEVKVAVVTIRRGVDAPTARTILKSTGGRLRPVMEGRA
jgi:N-acetylmuramic acid 6-phosphate etherase